MKTSLKVLLAIVGMVATIAFIVFLLPRLVLWYWGNNAKVYETNNIADYGAFVGNYDNETPSQQIMSFFPEQCEDYFSNVVYHYKAKKLDTYAYECYLEFTIEDSAQYNSFLAQYVEEEKCTDFLYDTDFQEYTISNTLVLQENNDESVYPIESAYLGKILFSNQQQRIVFFALGVYDGGGTNTEELGYFFSRFQIDSMGVCTEHILEYMGRKTSPIILRNDRA